MKKAIYPGTFDPITLGHLDIIQRATTIFDSLIIAIAASTRKSPLFSLEQRRHFVKLATQQIPHVEICSFEGLLVDLAQAKEAHIIIRGIRAAADFEYELQLAAMNRRLSSKIETIFLTPAAEQAFISATIVREIISLGGDASPFIPAAVAKELKK